MPARLLTLVDEAVARSLVASDPVTNVFVGSRLDAGVLSPFGGGVLWGWPGDSPRALLHVGANMVPVGAVDPAAMAAFVEAVGRRRSCQSIVGPATLAGPLWRALGERWGPAYRDVREIRRSQPLMELRTEPLVAADQRLRPVTLTHFESYLAASVAMYREEVGSDPVADSGAGYRNYCRWLVESGRAFGIVEDGEVVFKADIGASHAGVAQIQGVWLTPRLRGRGLSAPAMAGVVEYVLADYAVASLYVNDFNTRAVRLYERIGFSTVGEFATFLY